MTEFAICRGAFIGCASDAKDFGALIETVWRTLPLAGDRPGITVWQAGPDRSDRPVKAIPCRIAHTSDSHTNPVFVVFAHGIGEPVRPPEDRVPALRHWLDTNGWEFIAIPDKAGAPAPADGADADERIPLTGPLYEVFDALRVGGCKDVFVYDMRALAPSAAPSHPDGERQAVWCRRILKTFKARLTVRTPKTYRDFENDARRDLLDVVGMTYRDPLVDPLPGLDPVGVDEPLLVARRQETERLAASVLSGEPRLTALVAPSGTGKSSLLRRGLIRTWFRRMPVGAGYHTGAVALLVEPEALITPAAPDPLETLARLLTSKTPSGDARIVGPCPAPLAVSGIAPGGLPEPTGDLQQDLPPALDWWQARVADRSGPVVLLIDQAELIPAIARRQMHLRQDPTGIAPTLDAYWARFTGLLAALAGSLDPAHLTAELERRIAEVTGDAAFRLVIAARRDADLDLWPLDAASRERIEHLAPLHREEDWKALIETTFHLYGLEPDATLRDAMVAEATALASRPPPQRIKPAGDGPHDSSVLPRVRAALRVVMEYWRLLKRNPAENPQTGPALDYETFAPYASIAGSIEKLGELAWHDWREGGVKLSAYPSIWDFRRDAENPWPGPMFERVMTRLVDIMGPEDDILLCFSPADDVFRADDALLKGLKTQGLLSEVDTGRFRLSHLTILDHWSNARTWLHRRHHYLSMLIRLNDAFAASTDPRHWPDEHLDGYCELALRLICEGRDEPRLDYLLAGLLARLDAAAHGNGDDRSLDWVPFLALYSADEAFFDAVMDFGQASDRWPDLAATFMIISAQEDRDDAMERALDRLPEADRARLCDIADRHSGERPVHGAARRGSGVTLRFLLAEGAAADPDEDGDGDFPLLSAAQNGRDAAVTLLLEAGADPNRRSSTTGDTPLYRAVRCGFDKTVGILLQYGADPQGPDEAVQPLLEAAKRGHAAIVKMLLDRGADPDCTDPQGETRPLQWAALRGHTAVCECLLEAGAKVDLPEGADTISPLRFAAGRPETDTLALLLRFGADPNVIDTKGGDFPLRVAAETGNVDAVERLLAAGADADLRSPTLAVRPLLTAAGCGHDKIVRTLLEHGADPSSAETWTGMFPLYVAAEWGHDRVAKALLEYGADPEQVQQATQVSPLLVAAVRGHADVVTHLLEAGADPNRIDDDTGAAPILTVALGGQEASMRLLLHHGADPDPPCPPNATQTCTPLSVAAGSGHAGIVRLLLEAGADPNRVEPNGRFALFEAALNGHHGIVELLLANGADATLTSDTSRYALSAACISGDVRAVALLLEHGADPDRVDPTDGTFPLLLAAKRGHTDIARLLLDHGATPDQIDPVNGLFPLLLASMSGHDGVVAMLLQHGAKPNRETESGTFPLRSAAQFGHDSVIRILLGNDADIDQTDYESGATPLIAAIGGARRSTPSLLLEQGAETRSLSREYRMFLKDRVASAQAEQTPCAPAGTDLSVPAVFGNWITRPLDPYDTMEHRAILRQLGIPNEDFVGHVTNAWLPLHGEKAVLRYWQFAFASANYDIVAEVYWIDFGSDHERLIFHPFGSFDELVSRLSAIGWRPDFRSPDTKKTWASLFALVGDVQRYPVHPGAPAPIDPETEQALDPLIWRQWVLTDCADGPYVRLPWIHDGKVVWGSIRVPDDGFSIGVIDDISLLIGPTDRQPPRYLTNEDGDVASFRVVEFQKRPS